MDAEGVTNEGDAVGSIGYNATVDMLGLGDVFAFEERAETHTVRGAALSVDGSVVHLSYANGGHDTPIALRRVFRTCKAPACRCGVRFEHCENECVWPDALWDI